MKTISNINLIKRIDNSLNTSDTGRNSMGCSESNYDIYYMMGRALSKKDIKSLTKNETRLLIKLAKYASEVFY